MCSGQRSKSFRVGHYHGEIDDSFLHIEILWFFGTLELTFIFGGILRQRVCWQYILLLNRAFQHFSQCCVCSYQNFVHPLVLVIEVCKDSWVIPKLDSGSLGVTQVNMATNHVPSSLPNSGKFCTLGLQLCFLIFVYFFITDFISTCKYNMLI